MSVKILKAVVNKVYREFKLLNSPFQKNFSKSQLSNEVLSCKRHSTKIKLLINMLSLDEFNPYDAKDYNLFYRDIGTRTWKNVHAAEINDVIIYNLNILTYKTYSKYNKHYLTYQKYVKALISASIIFSEIDSFFYEDLFFRINRSKNKDSFIFKSLIKDLIAGFPGKSKFVGYFLVNNSEFWKNLIPELDIYKLYI